MKRTPPQKPFDKQMKHMFNLCFVTTFLTPEGNPATRYMAVTLIQDETEVRINDIRQAQLACLAQLTAGGIVETDVKDITMMASSYLGRMTPEYFQALPKKEEPLVLAEPNDNVIQLNKDS